MNIVLLQQLAQGWLDCAEADNQHAKTLRAKMRAEQPRGDSALSEARLGCGVLAERLNTQAWARNNCAFELQRLLFELQKENPPMGGPLAPETDCESA